MNYFSTALEFHLWFLGKYSKKIGARFEPGTFGTASEKSVVWPTEPLRPDTFEAFVYQYFQNFYFHHIINLFIFISTDLFSYDNYHENSAKPYISILFYHYPVFENCWEAIFLLPIALIVLKNNVYSQIFNKRG